jgi:DNA polymerase-3 subunit delta'
MIFKDVVGQQSAKKGFLNYYNAKRLPHAMLITGNNGVGGLAFGLAVAQFLMCEQPTEIDACGICNACVKMQKMVHPDVHFSFPTISPKPGTKAASKHYISDFRTAVIENPYISTFDWLQYINAENKQGNITAEECREIADQLQLKSFEGGNKIQLVWRPEYLGKEGNILLKLIEEPPANTYLILVAEDVEDILNTILSRTQQIQLLPIAYDEITAALEQQYQVDAVRARQIAQISEGSYGQAIRQIEVAENDLLGLMKNWFNGIFTNKGVLIHEWVENMSKLGREQQKNFLMYAQQMISHTMRYSNMPAYQAPLTEEEQIFAQKIATRNYPLSVFYGLEEALATACYHIERNVHGKTQLLYLSVQVQYILQGKQL